MKTITIQPLVDIIYKGKKHLKDSEPFEVEVSVGKSLIKSKSAKEKK